MSKVSKIKTNERREFIKAEVEKNGMVNVVQLANIYGTSQATIRTDLKEMEKANQLHRIHGGAVSVSSAYKSYYDTTLNERMNINKSEKIKIAKACAALVEDGDIVMIDSGTTNCYLAKELLQKESLTVLTNTILIAQELFYNPSIKVLLFGGDIESTNQFAYGNDTITQLLKYRANKFLLAIDGISITHGVTTYHHQEVEISRLMMDRANEVIALADHSKIGKEGFSFISPLERVNTLVTDDFEANQHILDEIEARGIKVIRT